MKDTAHYVMMSGIHRPKPRKKHGTNPHHLAPTPKKTGVFSSGGGTGTATGRLIRKQRKRTAFAMPRPDKFGYYDL